MQEGTGWFYQGLYLSGHLCMPFAFNCGSVVDKFFKNLGSSGVTSVRLNLDGRDADFEVDQIKYRNFTLDFVPLPILDHPQLFSATLTPALNGSIHWVPKDQIDTVDGGMEPRIQIRYTESPFGKGVNGSNNGMVAEWRTGALAEIPTSSVTQLHTDWYTAQGLECLGVKHFQRYRVI